jgi:dienelactone hydrolase
LITALSHTTIWVLDQNEALEFNTQKLGFELNTDACDLTRRVPVQVHYAVDDRLIDVAAIDALATAVRAAGASFEVHTYPTSSHLFADPDLPDYDRASAELMLQRVLDFLGRL